MAAPSWHPYGQGRCGNQQLATPHPQEKAVAVTAASNGVGNRYVIVAPAPAGPSNRQNVMKAFGRWGKLLEDSARKATDKGGNIWHHLRAAQNMGKAAVARLAQETKVFAEGGHERVFHQTFGAMSGEKLRETYACYLSPSSGPVTGTIYLSTVRLAFCGDIPPTHQGPTGHPPEWMHYKVVLPLSLVSSVNPSFSTCNRSTRYIQVTTTDNHEFRFMGFVSYDKALKDLYEALQHRDVYGHQNSYNEDHEEDPEDQKYKEGTNKGFEGIVPLSDKSPRKTYL